MNGTHAEDLNILRRYYFRLSFALQNGGDDILEIDLIDFLEFDARVIVFRIQISLSILFMI